MDEQYPEDSLVMENMKTLEEIKKKLTTLRTDKSESRWPETTLVRAPHKPFLLLSIMDHIAQGVITDNYIEPTLDLVDTFNTYWSTIMPMDLRIGSMAYPFSRLANDGLWELVPVPGKNINIDSITSMRKLIEVCAGARFDGDAYQFFQLQDARERLRVILIQTYFAKEIQSKVETCGVINQNSYKYSKALLVAEQPTLYRKSEDKPVRDQGFRKAIVSLYEHRCALCGIRIRTEEGHTAVDAAHIIPWSETQDDRVTNGMALCKLCHWSYDKGLMTVNTNYIINVSNRIQTTNNLLNQVQALSNREILGPINKQYWPGQENLEWHIKQRFKKAL